MIAGLGMAKELGVDDTVDFSDSMLVVCQITGEFQVREERMVGYY